MKFPDSELRAVENFDRLSAVTKLRYEFIPSWYFHPTSRTVESLDEHNTDNERRPITWVVLIALYADILRQPESF